MTTDQDIENAALALRASYENGTPCAPVREAIRPGGLEAAYAVQEVNTRHWLEAGRRLSGRKIGLTSHAVQRQLGVDQPDYGMLFADMDVPEGAEIDLGRVLQPKAEAEIAFVLGRDLDMDHVTSADVLRAVDYAVPALEIVGSRVANWDIKIWDTIADNASSGLYVLGTRPHRLGDVDLALCGMVIERAGEPVSIGAGAACLGNPLNAAVWLAQTMVLAGRPLLAGDVVLTGALGPMVDVSPGDVLNVKVNGFGRVRAAFAAQNNKQESEQ